MLAASGLLACIGLTLLSHTGTATPRSRAAGPPRSAAPAPASGGRAAPAAPSGTPASPSASPSAGRPSSTAGPLPDAITTAARRFVVAWTGHDARPGHDTSFNDAAGRAAAFADKELGKQLAVNSPGSTRQWQQWTTAKAVVTAKITNVAVPDGAPAPTADTAWVKVRYRLTVTPAAGRPDSRDQQVVLKLGRVPAGSWLVTALPDA